jgi:hypothetical protein
MTQTNTSKIDEPRKVAAPMVTLEADFWADEDQYFNLSSTCVFT